MKYKNVFFSFVVVFFLMGCGNALAHPPSTVVYEYEDDCCDHYCYDYHDTYYGNTVVVPAPRHRTVVHKHYHNHHRRYQKRSRAQRIVRGKRYNKRYRSHRHSRRRAKRITRTRTQWHYR